MFCTLKHCKNFALYTTSFCKVLNKTTRKVTLTPLSWFHSQVRAWHRTLETNPFLHVPLQTTSSPAAPGQWWCHSLKNSSGYLFLQSKSKVLVLLGSLQAAPVRQKWCWLTTLPQTGSIAKIKHWWIFYWSLSNFILKWWLNNFVYINARIQLSFLLVRNIFCV